MWKQFCPQTPSSWTILAARSRSLNGLSNKYFPCSSCLFCIFKDLKDYMRQAGEVTYADAHKDRKNEG